MNSAVKRISRPNLSIIVLQTLLRRAPYTTTSSSSLAHYTSAELDAMVSTGQVIHLLRADTDTFPSLTARSSHKYISSDDKRWQKMLHKFTTNYRETDLSLIKVLFAQGKEMTWDEKQLCDFELHHCSVFG